MTSQRQREACWEVPQLINGTQCSTNSYTFGNLLQWLLHILPLEQFRLETWHVHCVFLFHLTELDTIVAFIWCNLERYCTTMCHLLWAFDFFLLWLAAGIKNPLRGLDQKNLLHCQSDTGPQSLFLQSIYGGCCILMLLCHQHSNQPLKSRPTEGSGGLWYERRILVSRRQNWGLHYWGLPIKALMLRVCLCWILYTGADYSSCM